MFIVVVNIRVKPEFVEPFIAATLDNARNSIREPGNLRFDVSRAADDPHRFVLYEVYYTEEDFKAHQRTEHYFRWRDSVNDWMAETRQASRYQSLFPDADEMWPALKK